MFRRPIFAANWKMNKGPSDTEDFVKSFLSKAPARLSSDVVIAASFISLPALGNALKESRGVETAAQNCSQFDDGAYTGETSVKMLREILVRHVIIGHSERRSIFGETNAMINAKMKKAREVGLKLIFCIGETLEERNVGKLEAILRSQITEGLAGITAEDMEDTVIAYEPVWAIGTGVTASAQQAQDAHAFVRSVITDLYGAQVSSKLRIQYGGSVKPNNAAELMACPDIDGALIGGAALDPQSFIDIIVNGSAE
jgi:triosephosphate isomerase (TIM)